MFIGKLCFAASSAACLEKLLALLPAQRDGSNPALAPSLPASTVVEFGCRYRPPLSNSDFIMPPFHGLGFATHWPVLALNIRFVDPSACAGTADLLEVHIGIHEGIIA